MSREKYIVIYFLVSSSSALESSLIFQWMYRIRIEKKERQKLNMHITSGTMWCTKTLWSRFSKALNQGSFRHKRLSMLNWMKLMRSYSLNKENMTSVMKLTNKKDLKWEWVQELSLEHLTSALTRDRSVFIRQKLSAKAIQSERANGSLSWMNSQSSLLF